MNHPAVPERILLVEDDNAFRETLAELLSAKAYEVLARGNAREALDTLRAETVDAVVTDLMMPGMKGDALLPQIRSTFPEVPVIAITAFGSVESAAKLTRAGAADYLTKPFRTQALLDSLRRVLEESRPRREQARARRAFGRHLEEIVGRSQPMLRLFERIGRVGGSPAPVLITGETGTGKELVAAAVHRASGRGPFVAVNCGAISDDMLESELFGHARGSFAGASRDTVGLFESADGGTLFLDEIAELPPKLQPKLLRVLQSGEFRRVGETTLRQTNARVVTATNRDLQTAIQEGDFREDLYWRLNVLRLEVPSLRERPVDVPLLVEYHLGCLAQRDGRPESRVAPAALAALVAYSWPGNVRELLNVVEHAAVLADCGEIGLDHLPDHFRAAEHRAAIVHLAAEHEVTLEQLERDYILEVLRRTRGNKTLTAEWLGLPRRTLYRRLEEYGIAQKV